MVVDCVINDYKNYYYLCFWCLFGLNPLLSNDFFFLYVFVNLFVMLCVCVCECMNVMQIRWRSTRQ